MAKTYTTTITHLQGAPNYDGKENVITKVEFTIECVDGEYSHKANSHLDVNYDSESFIEFANLTEQNVIDWIENHPVYEFTKTYVDEMIANMKVPMDYGLEKPW
jgi:hypothetical protein